MPPPPLLQIAFGCFGVAAAIFGFSLRTLYVANNILVLGTVFAAVIFLLVARLRPDAHKPLTHDVRVFINGFLIWLLFILQAISTALKLFPAPISSFSACWCSLPASAISPRTAPSPTRSAYWPSARNSRLPARSSIAPCPNHQRWVTGARVAHHLRPEDRCLLYTDGAFEATNAALEEFDKPRLQNFLQTHIDLPAERFTSAFLDEISRRSGHATGRSRDDDITLLVLDFRNSPEPAG